MTWLPSVVCHGFRSPCTHETRPASRRTHLLQLHPGDHQVMTLRVLRPERGGAGGDLCSRYLRVGVCEPGAPFSSEVRQRADPPHAVRSILRRCRHEPSTTRGRSGPVCPSPRRLDRVPRGSRGHRRRGGLHHAVCIEIDGSRLASPDFGRLRFTVTRPSEPVSDVPLRRPATAQSATGSETTPPQNCVVFWSG